MKDKNYMIHLFAAIFMIIILSMQASLRLGSGKPKVIRYRNLKTSDYHQKIIRENILTSNKDNKTKSPILRGRYTENYSQDKDIFYTPRESHDFSTLRRRKANPRRGIFDNQSPFTRKSSLGLNTPDRGFTPRRTLGSQFGSKYDFEGRRHSPLTTNKYDYVSSLGRPRETFRKKELRDYEDREESKTNYYKTMEELGIGKSIGYWIQNTKEWIYTGIIKKLLILDRENFKELSRQFQRIGFDLIVSKNEHSRSPYKSEQMFKARDDSKLLDIEDLTNLELKQDLVDQLYGKYYYAVKNKPLFKVEGKLKEDLEELLQQRRDIEKYFRIEGFAKETRPYVTYRIARMVESSSFQIHYNSGESWQGQEWSHDFPTDAEIIMWLF